MARNRVLLALPWAAASLQQLALFGVALISFDLEVESGLAAASLSLLLE